MAACIFALMHTIGSSFQDLRDALRLHYSAGEALSIAQASLEHVTGLTRLQRMNERDTLLSEDQFHRFLKMKKLLSIGMPLQYVTGEAFFLGRTFKVSSAVLIPRPETEELVQRILEREQPATILDIGTGSGCMAISLNLAWPECEVTAIDVSEDALAIAIENAQKLGATVNFQIADFLNEKGWEAFGQYDVIVSNPPYIPISEKEQLDANVREHEPETALFVPDNDALLFYRKIAHFGKKHLADQGSIYCELHQDYAMATEALFLSEGYSSVTLRSDINGNQRMLHAKL